jgi:hypothetical protein
LFEKIEDALANQGATLTLGTPMPDRKTNRTFIAPQRVMVGGADTIENLLPKSP